MAKKVFLYVVVLVSFVIGWAQASAQTYETIRPGRLWLDTEGKPIHAHSPQIFVKDGVYYWYGENKEHTTAGSNVWTWGIRAYRSTDFYNWQDLGLIIQPDTVNPLSPLHYSQTLDRPHILYNETTRKWVCWIKSMDTDGYFVILQADRFEGPYVMVKSLKPEGFGVGDFDMYADPATGRAYVWFERPHWEMICAELTDDYLGTNGKYSEHFVGLRPPYTREAPSHFVHRGRHYMFTSGTTGYVPNPSKVCVFDAYHGEYTDLGCPHIADRWQDSFSSQIACVVKIPGKDLYVALADRWLPQMANSDISMRTVKSYAERYKEHKPFDRDFSTPQVKDKTDKRRGKWDTTQDSRYVFLPVTFDEAGKPTLQWQDEWRLEDYDIPARHDVGPQAMTATIEPIVAPFEMPQLTRPVFKNKKIEVRMTRKGMSTKPIQQAIDRLSSQGGGTVVIPAGRWQSGRLELKSGVELHLSEGCELCFSGHIKDYLPVVFTRDEGIEIQSLGACIYANGAHDIALTGRGRIIGPATDSEIYQNNQEKAVNIETIVMPDMPIRSRIFDGRQNGGAVFLPKTIAPINCSRVLIEGVTLDSCLYWNVVPQYCDSVIIRGVTVRSYGHGRTDGIDVESSRNVLIEYCSLDCQDDCYTMKSGRGLDGVRVGRPTENVVVRRCLALRGAGGIVCGTEVAGGVRNVYCADCVFDGTDQAFRFKTLRPRGGGVENVIVERVRARVTDYGFFCDMLGSIKWGGDLAKRGSVSQPNGLTPNFNTISISNVIVEGCQQLVKAIGLPERPLSGVLMRGVRGSAKDFLRLRDVNGFVMDDVDVAVENTEARIDGCQGTMFINTRLNGQALADIKYEGEKSTNVIFTNN
ncbi:MAG: family 43 glycosylhydrolase [Prevotella sp.]|nr:family 43 glycosylhydrolase [Prevotella sp.]